MASVKQQQASGKETQHEALCRTGCISKRNRHLAFVGDGQVCSEMKIVSHPEDLPPALSSIEVHLGRVGLEAGPLSQWVFKGLARAGLGRAGYS